MKRKSNYTDIVVISNAIKFIPGVIVSDIWFKISISQTCIFLLKSNKIRLRRNVM